MNLFKSIFGPSNWEVKYYELLNDYTILVKQYEDLRAEKVVQKAKAKTKKAK